MAETGCDREEARALAQEMVGGEVLAVRLPAAEQPLIDLACATVSKWRIAVGMGGMKRLGFDLGEIDVAARWMGITPDARLLEGLGMIEREALRVLEAK